MTPILHRDRKSAGESESGFALLRGMISICILLVCFSAILISLASLSRRSVQRQSAVQREITARNQFVKESL